MAFSRPIARMISWQASSAPPGALTVGEFTRVGVFLLGLFALPIGDLLQRLRGQT